MISFPDAFSELAKHNQFILYTTKEIGKKIEKYPLDYRTLKKHNAHDSDVWLSAEQAMQYVNLYGSEYGVGFVLTETDNIGCIDIDNCVNDKQEYSELAVSVLKEFEGCAVETSKSGKGVHIFFTYNDSSLTSHKTRIAGVEVYTRNRFIALTGLGAHGDSSINAGAALKRLFEGHGVSESEPLCHEWTTSAEHGYSFSALSDAELLHKALRNQNFNALFTKNTAALAQKYPHASHEFDESQADMALAVQLAWWTGKNCERIKTLMLMSGLTREKWKREDYLDRTIRAAYAFQKTYAKNIETYKLVEPTDYPHYFERKTGGTVVLDTHENLKFLLDTAGVDVKYNIMKRTREVIFPNFEVFVDDKENHALHEVENLAIKNYIKPDRVNRNLTALSYQKAYHPIVDCIRDRPWDGILRLEGFTKTIETSGCPELSKILIKRWMLSVIASIHADFGFSAQGVLVLQGLQGLKKTTWLKRLDPINSDAIKEGAIIDPANKDNVIMLSKYMIVEFGELDASLRKTDIARIKSFITSQMDEYRAAYAVRHSTAARRTVYAASVNPDIFLSDDTGNRRWWTIPVASVKLEHGYDIQQVWAEAKYLYDRGESPFLTDSEAAALNEINKGHQALDPFEDRLLAKFDFSSKCEHQKSASEILALIGFDRPTRSDTTRMGNILSRVLQQKSVNVGGRRVYLLPTVKNSDK